MIPHTIAAGKLKTPPKRGRARERTEWLIMWNRHKHTADMSPAELELQEVFELLGKVRCELMEIKAMADDLYFKAQTSHSLIVVRKISEDRVDELNHLLD